MRSMIEFGRSAATMPSGTASTIVTVIEHAASRMVTGAWVAISLPTGWRQ